MTEPTIGQVEFARKIARQLYPATGFGIAYDAALAAIMETQESCAKLAEQIEPIGDRADEAEYFLGACGMGEVISARIRAGEHYGKEG